MRVCSVCRQLEIVPGSLDDYMRLAQYHYRGDRLGPLAGIFALKPTTPAGASGAETIGVIAYTMPRPTLEMRNVATGDYFLGFDRQTQLALVNKNIRCIGRVIIEPRYRGLGLASRLVRQTMPKINVPIIEALAVMGWVNPFLQRAGMKAFEWTAPVRNVALVEAFSLVGIEQGQLIDPTYVHRKLEQLSGPAAKFLEHQIRYFLRSHGRRRNMPASLERTRYLLSRLTFPPIYYIWFNPQMRLSEQ